VQPKFTVTDGERMGLEVVWSDDTWVLWRIPTEAREAQAAEMAAAARGELPATDAPTTLVSGG
jgi:hypothetical protein